MFGSPDKEAADRNSSLSGKAKSLVDANRYNFIMNTKARNTSADIRNGRWMSAR